MEASETGRRIFWRHRWLLLVLVILPVAGVVVLREGQPVTYAATAVIQGQGTTPDSTTQVSAIQSRVAAVATAPDEVQQAINQAKVSADALQVAKHEITVSPMSTSAIMTITVTDRDPQVALGLTRALAQELPKGMAAVPLNPGIIDTDMLRSTFGGSSRSYPSPEAWSERAVPFLLGLGPKDNGKPLTAP